MAGGLQALAGQPKQEVGLSIEGFVNGPGENSLQRSETLQRSLFESHPNI